MIVATLRVMSVLSASLMGSTEKKSPLSASTSARPVSFS